MSERSIEFDGLCSDLGLLIPDSSTVVHKSECLYSIDTEYSLGGIYVNLLTYQSFGKDLLKFDPIYPNAIYLNIVKRLIPCQQEPDLNEFNTTDQSELVVSEKKVFEESVEYNVFSPQLGSIPLDHTFGQLLNLCNSIIGHAGYEFKNNQLTFSNILNESKYARDLYQVENPKRIDYDNLSCEKCNATTNLWLNLSDGYVGCGRKNYNSGGCQDGTEGAAILHYHETGSKYHLAVKIGTVTPNSADVYSYSPDEDNLVIDPLLEEHLKHFGINIHDLRRTEKTLLELELEDNKNYNWLSDASGASLIHLQPKLIGILNLGNNCYLNSVLQMLNNVKELNDFFLQYYQTNLQNKFENVNLFLLQYAKICTCINTDVFIHKCNQILDQYKNLLSESHETDDSLTQVLTHDCFYINPNLFKFTLGLNNSVFNNNEQQDAEEFLSFFINYLFDNIKDLKSLFQLQMNQIIICEELKLVNVNHVETHILPFELMDIINSKINSLNSNSTDIDDINDINDIEIDITDCVLGWYGSVLVDYISSGKVYKANLYNNLTNAPSYLFVKLNRFYMDKVPKKLLNKVTITGEKLELNLNHLNLKEFQDYTQPPLERNSGFYEVDESFLNQLLLMGFNEFDIRRSHFVNKSTDVDVCVNWILGNMTDPDTISSSLSKLRQLGHTDDHLNMKLLGFYGNSDKVVSYYEQLKTEQLSDNVRETVVYDLIGFITHIGSNVNSGHYICHLKKDNEWYAFNDTRITKSTNPPIHHGYIYLFQKS